jgi:hypothetical protein
MDVATLEEEDRLAVDVHKTHVQNLVAATCTFVHIYKENDTTLREMEDIIADISASAARKVTGDRITGYFYDHKLFGEADARPEFRLPYIGADLIQALFKAVLFDHRSATEGEMGVNDFIVLMTGNGPKDDQRLVKAVFGKSQKERHIKTLYMGRDLSSVSRRLSRVRGHCARPQLETVYLVTRLVPNAQQAIIRPFTHHGGDNSGNFLGMIVDEPELEWIVDRETKKTILGPHYALAVGGKTPIEDCGGMIAPKADLADQKEDDRERQPVFYHSIGSRPYEDFVTAWDMKSVVDLTAGEGALALACLRAKRPYVGLCITRKHAEDLMTRLTDLVLNLSLQHGTVFYSATVVNVLTKTTTPTVTTVKREAPAEAEPAKPAKKAKKATKKQQEAAADGFDGGDGSQATAEDADDKGNVFGFSPST